MTDECDFDFETYTNEELISEMECSITSGGMWKWCGRSYTHYEYVSDDLWNEIKKRLRGAVNEPL